MNYDLRTLADRAELHDLLLQLGRALDEHRFGNLKDVLAQDAIGTTRNGIGSGRDVLIAQIEAGNKDYARLLHRFSSVLIEVDGDTATIRAYITALSGHADSLLPASRRYGLARNKAVRTPDGWRFSELNVEPVFVVGQ
ncbi:nuclear transport factor 2 family protein [Streptomyces sp. NBC_01198]|uniref:nuclear transport factor 2 family protein n=1 Tax=Streptomyces sp. NBC_01198 TaxID=2903769 RepID=UPI002E0D8F75|nr:nuclear transport factor 2 family protein [Streptomyces sp. NBC_01198]